MQKVISNGGIAIYTALVVAVCALAVANTSTIMSWLAYMLQDSFVRSAFTMGCMYYAKGSLLRFSKFLYATVAGGRSVIATLKIVNDEENGPVYDKICFWLANKYKGKVSNSRLKVDRVEGTHQRDDQSVVLFQPDNGAYLLVYKGRWVWCDVTSQQLPHGTGWTNKPGSVRSVVLTAFRWKASELFKQIVDEADACYKDLKSPNQTTIWQPHWWRVPGEVLVVKKRVTNLDTIVLSNNVKTNLLKVLDNFRDHPEIWHEQNLSHRESILLVGPPGNGKTMLINFIAGYLGYDIMLVSLTNPEIDDNGLLKLFGRVNPRTLICIEEIDLVCPKRDFIREEKSNSNKKSISLGGILLALDGPTNKDGPIVVATSNHYEKLDEALIRVGRFNHHIKLDWSDKDQQATLYKRYFPKATEKDVETLQKNFENKQISCAALVGFLRQYKIEENSSAHSTALKAATFKGAREVGGDRINLESPLAPFLKKCAVSDELVDEIISSHCLTTVRQFKRLDIAKLLAPMSEPQFNPTIKDLSVLAEVSAYITKELAALDTKKTRELKRHELKKKQLKKKSKSKKEESEEPNGEQNAVANGEGSNGKHHKGEDDDDNAEDALEEQEWKWALDDRYEALKDQFHKTPVGPVLKEFGMDPVGIDLICKHISTISEFSMLRQSEITQQVTTSS